MNQNYNQKIFINGEWVNAYPTTTATQVIVDSEHQFITQAEKDALAGKEDKSNKGVAGGYASLDSTGKVPMEQMPTVLNHNKGYFASLDALKEALPTAEAGDFAIVGSTDTVYVWDADGEPARGWTDSSTPGTVISVNGKTGAVTITWDDLIVPDASTSVKGVVQLSSSVDSESENVAATPKAVKTIMDVASGRAKITLSDTAPINPAEGDFWFDTSSVV